MPGQMKHHDDRAPRTNYKTYGCRCEPCVAGTRAYERAHRTKDLEKYRARVRTSRAKNRAALNQIKLAAGCVDCGYNDHPAALDFDHVRGEKLCDVARAFQSTADVVLTEIAKCDVVCANCHRVRTAERRKS